MTTSPEEFHELARHCETCREDMRDKLAAFDRRLLSLEIVVRGEDGRNGIKSQLNTLCLRFDAFEKRAIRWIAVGTALPGIVVGVVATLKLIGRI
ncbi:MAG: hypothetical protein ACFUZC_08130 [Chthoniobacteraceae bacterium]